jgi:hypothetical protein
VAKGIAYANGIVTNYGGDTVYVSESTEQAVRVYERKDNNNLRFKGKLDVFPCFADNLYFEPVNGDIIVAGATNPVAFNLDAYKKVRPARAVDSPGSIQCETEWYRG